jgi:hypothetical protein
MHTTTAPRVTTRGMKAAHNDQSASLVRRFGGFVHVRFDRPIARLTDCYGEAVLPAANVRPAG